MKKTSPSERRPGFTLIEMLVTITIIVILAGLSLGGFKFVSAKQANAQAEIQIKLLSSALEEYKLDFGTYPGAPFKNSAGAVIGYYGGADASNANGKNTPVLYTALYREGFDFSENPSRADAENIKATKIYLSSLDPDNNKQGWTSGSGAAVKLVDPWGNDYLYRYPGTSSPDFDLISMGQDGRTNADPNHADSKDDKTNF